MKRFEPKTVLNTESGPKTLRRTHVKLRNNQSTLLDSDDLAEAIFHITGAQDLAFEFLQRLNNPNTYDPWAAKKSQSSTNSPASQEAIRDWQQSNSYPLQIIRDYRNHLTHGRMLPNIIANKKLLFPKVGSQNDYLDWRIITDGYPNTAIMSDFDSADNIIEDAWKNSIQYFETNWQNVI